MLFEGLLLLRQNGRTSCSIPIKDAKGALSAMVVSSVVERNLLCARMAMKLTLGDCYGFVLQHFNLAIARTYCH
jgi:hypothetical protein